jgi:ribosomal protein L35
MKTNKSFSKRLRITRRGKIVGRKAGQNHFNAKESGRKQMGRNRTLNVNLSNKAKARFLVGA